MSRAKQKRFSERYMADLIIVQQTTVHEREVSAFSSCLVATREALRTCLELVEASRRGMWTPADDKRLEEIRADMKKREL